MARWRQAAKNRRRKYSYNTSSSSGSKNFVFSIFESKNIAWFTKMGFLGVLILFFSAIIIIPILAITLPSADKVVRRDGFSTKILDRNGEVLYDIYEDQRRTQVDLEQIPDYVKQATIAIEDKNFYKHKGFDPLGTIRGLSRILTRGRAAGGSTLTQQLVKNALLSSERSVIRKVREFILAVQIENKYSKDEILELYLNEIPYGGTAFGVEAASELYFGKPVKELNLVESAFLAGLPQRPSAYSPYSNTPDAYVDRTTAVLRRMREDDYISKEQEESAVAELPNLEFQAKGASFKAPHFVQYVQTILEDRYGTNVVESGGLKVTTTLDLKLQDEAQNIVREEIEDVEGLHITNGSAVALDPETGEILAMVGSKNFNDPDYDGQVNVALSLRQPGSAIKPITYAAGLEKGYTASSLLMDVPTTFPGGVGQPDYEPVNYDGKYRGPMQVRFALPNSINVAAVKMLSLVGVKDMLQLAYDMGISSLEPTKETLSRVGLSVTLGGGEVRLLELTTAYAAFNNGGHKVEPVAILKVEDANGKVLEEAKPKKGKQVISEETAYLISDILSDNNARSAVFGLNSLLNIPGRQVMVKTGTTNDKRDNWTVGGNPQVVIGVWVGNNDNSPMTNVASGVTGASPIWRRIVLEALNGKPNVTFNQPGGIVTASVDTVSGFAAHDGFGARTEKFAKGSAPGEDPIHLKLKVCKGDGNLATPGDIAGGNYEEKEYYDFKEEDPFGPPNRWQEGILAWWDGNLDKYPRAPTQYCGGNNNQNTNPIHVDFDNPLDNQSNLDNQMEVRIIAQSTNDIDKVDLYIDGDRVRTFTGPPYKYDANLDDGPHVLLARVTDKKNNSKEREIEIGVNTPWDATPSPSPTP